MTSADPPSSGSGDSIAQTNRLLVIIAAAFVLLQIAVTVLGAYGYFIDEFYYIACARRPALGYVDHPPLAPLVLAVVRLVFGESLLAIRLPAFLLGGVIVWASGRLALEFGGRQWAAAATAVTIALSPGVLAMSGFFSVNVFEVAFWVACTWALVRLIKTGDPRWWIAIGLAAGLGFESKHTTSTLLVALGAGILATPARRLLLTRWAVFGAVVAATLALPNVVWQAMNGFPSLEFYRQAALVKNVPSPPLNTLADQLRIMGLLTSPIWIAGLVFLSITRDGSRDRAIAIAYVILLVLLVVSRQSRPDRLLGIYPVVIAAGFAWLGTLVRNPALRSFVLVAVAVGCLPGMPIVIGVLPPEPLARYTAWLGISTSGERGKRPPPIPQLLADRTGWEDFVAQVARIYEELPPAEKSKTLIYAPSYGQAGAVDVLGRQYGLPRAISGQNTYYHWSEREGVNSDVLIAVGARKSDLETIFRDVRLAATTSCAYCMTWRNEMPIYLAREPIAPLSGIWYKARHYE
jgi:hypothetical protein